MTHLLQTPIRTEQTIVLTSQVQGRSLTWTRRRFVARFVKLAQTALQTCLDKVQAAWAQLSAHKRAKKAYRDANPLQQAAQVMLKEYLVKGLIRLQIEKQLAERPVRAHGSRPAAIQGERTFHLRCQVDEATEIATARCLGRRAYATDRPQQTLSLALHVLPVLVSRCRQQLADQRKSLPGLCADNPHRSTPRPTA